MKFGDLKKGMILRVTDRELTRPMLAWITNASNSLPSGDNELRFIHDYLAGLVPGEMVPKDELIVYLGHDKVKVVDRNRTFTYKQLLRRALVGGKTVVVAGHNFKHLEPRPGFD